MSTSRPAVELVSIGEELLLGETVDTNAAWLARELASHGIRVTRAATVGDDEAEIRAAVAHALQRTGGVIATGGLGPTRDDRTRPAVAALFDRDLHVDEDLLAALRTRFAASGVEMPASNRCQAEVPEGATVLPNPQGTAPGLVLEGADGGFAIVLPGVPLEMQGIFREAVLPWLAARWPGQSAVVRHRVIRTTGIAESELAERLEPLFAAADDLAIAFLPGGTGVDVRLTSRAGSAGDEDAAGFERVEREVRARAGAWIYGIDDMDLVDAVAERLRARGQRLAVAESCTGGLVAKRLTDRAGASDYMLGGVVAYANDAKRALLDVEAGLIAAHGAVSEEVALAMTRGATRRFGADCAIAVTGVAGPSGGTPAKPVGTVCIAVRAGDAERARTMRFASRDRQEIRERSAQAALALLWNLLGEEEA